MLYYTYIHYEPGMYVVPTDGKAPGGPDPSYMYRYINRSDTVTPPDAIMKGHVTHVT
jgi:hypothetical protein